jgi:D-amino-acid dehydrogenase
MANPGAVLRPPGTVAVIGAGIIGVLSALEIQARGHSVILVDSGPAGGAQSASYGNGAWLNPGAIMPISVPGLWKKIPGYLFDRDGPFVIRWRHLPGLLPWLVRFVHAGSTWDKVKRCAVERYRLCAGSVDGHAAHAQAAGVGELVRRTGLIFVYRNRDEVAAEAREWDLRRRFGIVFSELDAEELRRLEPGLDSRYGLGMRIDAGAYLKDTRLYLEALVALLQKRGGVVLRQRVNGLIIEGGRLRCVRMPAGDMACDKAVIAAGAWSARLAAQAGDRIPLISERGYHVVLPGVVDRPNTALMPCDGKMAVTPTAHGLRVAGQVELAGLDTPPDWRRAQVLLNHARRMFPDSLPDTGDSPGPQTLQRWLGHRPSTPDGLPVIGPASGCADIIHAFGHGQSGLCQAPATAEAVAALIDGAAAPFPIHAFSPRRFGTS